MADGKGDVEIDRVWRAGEQMSVSDNGHSTHRVTFSTQLSVGLSSI